MSGAFLFVRDSALRESVIQNQCHVFATCIYLEKKRRKKSQCLSTLLSRLLNSRSLRPEQLWIEDVPRYASGSPGLGDDLLQLPYSVAVGRTAVLWR